MKEVTIFMAGMFGISKTPAKLIETGKKDYAQYKDAPFYVYIQKGKRTTIRRYITDNPFTVILEGYVELTPLDAMTAQTGNGGLVSSATRYASYDRRYRTEFDQQLSKFLADNPKAQIVIDLRDTVKSQIFNLYK